MDWADAGVGEVGLAVLILRDESVSLFATKNEQEKCLEFRVGAKADCASVSG